MIGQAVLCAAREKELVGPTGDFSVTRLHTQGGTSRSTALLSTSSTGLAAIVCGARAIPGMKRTSWRPRSSAPTEQLRRTVGAFRERRALVSAEEAKKTVAVCLAVEQALSEGREVTILAGLLRGIER